MKRNKIVVDLDYQLPVGVFIATSKAGYVDYGPVDQVKFDPRMDILHVHPEGFNLIAEAWANRRKGNRAAKANRAKPDDRLSTLDQVPHHLLKP